MSNLANRSKPSKARNLTDTITREDHMNIIALERPLDGEEQRINVALDAAGELERLCIRIRDQGLEPATVRRLARRGVRLSRIVFLAIDDRVAETSELAGELDVVRRG